eukprot:2589417-Amphidinium_carterae.1
MPLSERVGAESLTTVPVPHGSTMGRQASIFLHKLLFHTMQSSSIAMHACDIVSSSGTKKHGKRKEIPIKT